MTIRLLFDGELICDITAITTCSKNYFTLFVIRNDWTPHQPLTYHVDSPVKQTRPRDGKLRDALQTRPTHVRVKRVNRDTASRLRFAFTFRRGFHVENGLRTPTRAETHMRPSRQRDPAGRSIFVWFSASSRRQRLARTRYQNRCRIRLNDTRLDVTFRSITLLKTYRSTANMFIVYSLL